MSCWGLCEALGGAFTSTLRYHQERTYVRPPPDVLPSPCCVWTDGQLRQGLGGVAFISELGLVAAILESDFRAQRQK